MDDEIQAEGEPIGQAFTGTHGIKPRSIRAALGMNGQAGRCAAMIDDGQRETIAVRHAGDIQRIRQGARRPLACSLRRQFGIAR